MRQSPDYHIDFARPLFTWPLLRWPGVVIVVLLCILVMRVHFDTASQYQAIQALEQRQQALAAQRLQKKMQQTAQTALAEKRLSAKKSHVLQVSDQQSLQKMLRLLNLHWFDLLQALESSQVPEIALLQLTPDPNRGVFILSGEAKNYADLLAYVGHLQGLPALHQVYLQKHQVNDSHPQRPVSFEIAGGWQP